LKLAIKPFIAWVAWPIFIQYIISFPSTESGIQVEKWNEQLKNAIFAGIL
jgi:hypothetical protein